MYTLIHKYKRAIETDNSKKSTRYRAREKCTETSDTGRDNDRERPRRVTLEGITTEVTGTLNGESSFVMSFT